MLEWMEQTHGLRPLPVPVGTVVTDRDPINLLIGLANRAVQLGMLDGLLTGGKGAKRDKKAGKVRHHSRG